MRRKILFCSVAVLLGFSVSAVDARNYAFEANAGAAIPLSDLKDVAGTGGGGDVGVYMELGEKWYAKLTIGYHKFKSEDVVSVGLPGAPSSISGGFVPIKIGLVKFWDEGKHFYTTPSVGVYIGTGDFEDTFDESANFGLGSKVGWLFRYGEGASSVDVGVEFHNIFSDPEKVQYVALTVGFSFGIISQY